MKCQKNNSFNCTVTENSKKTNTSVALNWKYNPYKVEEDINRILREYASQIEL